MPYCRRNFAKAAPRRPGFTVSSSPAFAGNASDRNSTGVRTICLFAPYNLIPTQMTHSVAVLITGNKIRGQKIPFRGSSNALS
jgi:hypothetical protein